MNTVVEALFSWDAKIDSYVHLKSRLGLTPTTSNFENVLLRGAPACHELFTETVAHADSHTAVVSNSKDAEKVNIFCDRGRLSVLKVHSYGSNVS